MRLATIAITKTHAMLLGLYQALVAELIEQGALDAQSLAERLARAQAHVAPNPNGLAAQGHAASRADLAESRAARAPPNSPELVGATKLRLCGRVLTKP